MVYPCPANLFHSAPTHTVPFLCQPKCSIHTSTTLFHHFPHHTVNPCPTNLFHPFQTKHKKIQPTLPFLPQPHCYIIAQLHYYIFGNPILHPCLHHTISAFPPPHYSILAPPQYSILVPPHFKLCAASPFHQLSNTLGQTPQHRPAKTVFSTVPSNSD